MNKLIIVLVGLAVLIAGGVAILTHKDSTPLGAAPGPDFSNRVFFRDNAIIGGYDFATSSIGSVTYTAVSFANAKVIEHNATGALTATLPSGANLSGQGYLQNPGDTDTKYIHASTTKITFAGSTGVTLSSASTTKDISPNTTGILTCARLGASEGRLIQCLLIAD